jgi:structural maintenance of chromosome 2
MSEIQKVLANEITPTLERLRSEKKHYLKWSANNTEIEKLQRLCVAYQYSRAAEEVDKSADELKQMEDERERCVLCLLALRRGTCG